MFLLGLEEVAGNDVGLGAVPDLTLKLVKTVQRVRFSNSKFFLHLDTILHGQGWALDLNSGRSLPLYLGERRPD